MSCPESRSWRERRVSEIEASAIIFFQGSDLFEKYEGFVELSEALLSGERTTREIASDRLFKEFALECAFTPADVDDAFCVLDSLFTVLQGPVNFCPSHSPFKGKVAEVDGIANGFFDIEQHGTLLFRPGDGQSWVLEETTHI